MAYTPCKWTPCGLRPMQALELSLGRSQRLFPQGSFLGILTNLLTVKPQPVFFITSTTRLAGLGEVDICDKG